MKKKALFLIILFLMLIILSACNNNSIKDINNIILEKEKFISISILNSETTISTRGRVIQKNNNSAKELIVFFKNNNYSVLVEEIVEGNNILGVIYKEYIFNDGKCEFTEWNGNKNIEKMTKHKTINKSFEEIFNSMNFQESPRGIMIRYDKVDNINNFGEKNILNKNGQVYNGKFDLVKDIQSPPYEGEYAIWFSENYRTGFEFYNINYHRAKKNNYYRRFWYGDDAEMVLNDENDDFAEIFQEYFKKAQFDLFIEEIRSIEQ